jgi:hypothetical protein
MDENEDNTEIKQSQSSSKSKKSQSSSNQCYKIGHRVVNFWKPSGWFEGSITEINYEYEINNN